jgi:hypothetical protein
LTSDLGRIASGRDGDPGEKRPFLFSFSKPKVVVAWRKIGAMMLTRACLKHPYARSVANGQGPDAGKLEALAAAHKITKLPLPRPASTAHLRVPFNSHARFAAVNRRRKNSGACPAQQHQIEKPVNRLRGNCFQLRGHHESAGRNPGKTNSDATASVDSAALEFAQAEMAAAAAKDRRGDNGDDSMFGADLTAAMKLVHLKKSIKGGARTAPRKSAFGSWERFRPLGSSW